MPYAEYRPGRFRLEDESTGSPYLFIQKDGDFLWCDAQENVLQVLSNIKIGTSSERPSAGKKGRIYFETDTSRQYYDDGTNWVEFGGVGRWIKDVDEDTYISVEPTSDADKIVAYVAGNQVLNISTAGILSLQKQSYCYLTLTGSTQWISSNTWTKVEYDTIVVDRQNEADTTTHRVTVCEDGLYLVIASVSFKPASGGTHIGCQIRVNDVAKATNSFYTSANYRQQMTIAANLQLFANDYIEIYFISVHQSGDIYNYDDETYWMVYKVA